MGLFTTEEMELEIFDEGFTAGYAQEMVKGMYIAIPERHMSDRLWVKGVLDSVRRSTQESTVVQFVIIEDDGRTRTKSVGDGYPVWYHLEKSEVA